MPTIVVSGAESRGPASRLLLGVNHHYNRDGYGVWDASADAPSSAAVAGSRRAGLQSVRYPGGTIANLFDWKRAIGATRGCQVDGRGSSAVGFPAVTRGLAFGPDEYMRFVRAINARPLLMVPFVVGSPRDAADWVEYMNAPAGSVNNPNGGVDWAEVRAANGHPLPYHVRRWEVGNEQDHGNSRYWLSADTRKAVRQYAFGGSRVMHENLGRDCNHPLGGVRSSGQADQVFQVLYPPARGPVTVAVNGVAWSRVTDLSSSGADDQVFQLDAAAGTVAFGDGIHGAIPPSDATVTATYTTVHAGFFEIARAMKAVDPTIKVCSSWGTPDFVALVGGRRYDCLTQHPITSFAGGNDAATWSGPLEGHDAFMQATLSRHAQVARLLSALPRRTPLWLTEASTIQGDTQAFPSWATSASHAVYMASLWADWMNLRIPWGMGDDLLWGSDRAVLGPAPDYTFTADAVTRQALTPMFQAGGHVLATRVIANPVRTPPTGHRSYRALASTATRHKGSLFIMVVNRLALRTVTARIRLNHFPSTRSAAVRHVQGDTYTSWNEPGQPPSVRMTTGIRNIGTSGFVHTFPPTSTTVFRIQHR